MKFGKHWLHRHLDFELKAPGNYAIIGPNASGKSTLLKMVSGFMEPTEGEVEHSNDQGPIDQLQWFRHLSIASPYLELELLFSLREYLDLHHQLKAFSGQYDVEELASEFGLHSALDKRLSEFSSGMMQRLRIGLALAADTELVLLDEPLSNLDEAGQAWYREYLQRRMGKRLIIVFSNAREEEYFFCDTRLRIDQLNSK
jgi:ABC-type multidrug transport system ATPase subunit